MAWVWGNRSEAAGIIFCRWLWWNVGNNSEGSLGTSLPFSPQLCVLLFSWWAKLLTSRSPRLTTTPELLPPQVISFHRLFSSSPSWIHPGHWPRLLPRLPCKLLHAHQPQCLRNAGWWLVLRFFLLDTYFSSFSNKCIRSRCCPEFYSVTPCFSFPNWMLMDSVTHLINVPFLDEL